MWGDGEGKRDSPKKLISTIYVCLQSFSWSDTKSIARIRCICFPSEAALFTVINAMGDIPAHVWKQGSMCPISVCPSVTCSCVQYCVSLILYWFALLFSPAVSVLLLFSFCILPTCKWLTQFWSKIVL